MAMRPLPQDYSNPLAENNFGPLFEQYKITYGKALEFVQANLYDTVNYPPTGVTNLSVFDGTRNQTTNRVLCNMPGNTLPDRQGFLIMALQFIIGNKPWVSAPAAVDALQPGNLDVFWSLAFNGIFELRLYEKLYAQVPLIMLPAACGIWAYFTAPTTSGVTAIANNGSPDARNLYTMEEPVFIPPLVQIQAQMIWNGPQVLTITIPIPLKLNMGGLMVRPVQ